MAIRVSATRKDLRRGSLPLLLPGSLAMRELDDSDTVAARTGVRGQGLAGIGYRRFSRLEGKKVTYPPPTINGLATIDSSESSSGSSSSDDSDATVTRASHIAAKTGKHFRQFYSSQPTSPKSAGIYSESLSTQTVDSNNSTVSSPKPELLSPALKRASLQFLSPPPVPASPQPKRVTWQQDPDDCPSQGLFDMRKYTHLNLPEHEIREKIRKHAEWIRRGEFALFPKSKGKR